MVALKAAEGKAVSLRLNRKVPELLGTVQIVLELSEIESELQVVFPFHHGKAVSNQKGIGDGNQQLLILAPSQASGKEPRVDGWETHHWQRR